MRFLNLLFSFIIIGLLAGTSQAANVALFNNTAYVDYSPGNVWAEASNVEATLVSQGHTVSTFSGITAADFNNAVLGRDVLIIPELEKGNLNANLDSSARTAIANFVNNGGVFIGFGSSISNFINLVNTVFGFSLSSSGNNTPYTKNLSANGTPFESCANTLPYNNDTGDISSSSLPSGTRIIYNNGNYVGVFMAPYGSGWVVYIGWDWYDAKPIGLQDDGWLCVINAAVNLRQKQQTAIPAITTLGVIVFVVLLGALSIYFLRRKETY